MFDFEAIIKKHDESLIQQIVEAWEQFNHVRHAKPLSLEERWAIFINATEPVAARAAA